MKRIFCVLSALLLLGLCACGEAASPESETSANSTTEPQTTTEPLFTTTEPPTLLPIQEYWDGDLSEGFPILKEPAEDYYAVLERYRKIRAGSGLFWYEAEFHVMLHDFDGDFVPELIVKMYSNPYCEWHVYTLHKGKAYWLGSFDGTFRSALLSSSKGGLYFSQLDSGATGAGTVIWIRKQGNQLTKTTLATWTSGFERTWEEPSDSVLLLQRELGDSAWTY